jgi:predicted membrane protein
MYDDRWERRRLRWERRWERRQARLSSSDKHLFSGIVFVTLGVLFLLGNMGFIDVGAILRFWPVLLIAVGAFKIVESRDEFGQSRGIFWVVIGGFLLLGTLGVLRVAFHQLWPAILIALGALMLWRTSMAKRPRPDLNSTTATSGEAETEPENPSSSTSSTSHFSATAVLSGFQRRINSQDFRGGEATAILGGCQIDLRGASITPPHEPVIQVFALFGGIEIRVPDDWTVISNVEAILGGFDDKKTWPPKIESKRVIIRGQVIFGGIEVRN